MSRVTTRKEPVLRSVDPALRQGDPVIRSGESLVKDIVVTTTPGLEGRPVAAYLGVVTGEVVLGFDAFREASPGFFARLRGRSAPAGSPLAEAREFALRELKARAIAKGADAVVGVSLDHGAVDTKFIVSATGTAVRLGQ